MKKIIPIIMVLAFLLTSINAQTRKLDSSKEFKRILSKLESSVVKVIAENHKRYVTTGIAIDK